MPSGPERPRVALALVHHPVLRDRAGTVGSTSVTPLNVHDMARAARTYGVQPFYVVTPLLSQQALVGRILRHYREGHGGEANPTRAEALRDVVLAGSINEALDDLCRRAGAYPLAAGTTARDSPRSEGYREFAARVAGSDRPWILLFGTGWGLAPEAAAQCDVFLPALRGPGAFNHLPVRSAATVILDRLFGK
ncbi:MAG TPA: RNA methyltransferase [Candidatus Methanoperedens sp.]|nr:RNA methyltransferase [Candidatus Methanoperedens sp.]